MNNNTAKKPHRMVVFDPRTGEKTADVRTFYPVMLQHYLTTFGWDTDSCHGVDPFKLISALAFGGRLTENELCAVVRHINRNSHNPLSVTYCTQPLPDDFDPTTHEYLARRERLRTRRTQLAKRFTSRDRRFSDYALERFNAISAVLKNMDRRVTISNAEYRAAFECVHQLEDVFQYRVY